MEPQLHCIAELVLSLACAFNPPVAQDFYTIDNPTQIVQTAQPLESTHFYQVPYKGPQLSMRPKVDKEAVLVAALPVPKPTPQQEVTAALPIQQPKLASFPTAMPKIASMPIPPKVEDDGPPTLLSFFSGAPRTGFGALLKDKSRQTYDLNDIKLGDGSEDLKCYRDSPRLQSIVAKVKQKWGKPVVIESGYRSPTYNRRVSGARHSMHMNCSKGNGAIDFYVSGVSPQALYNFVGGLPETGGYGIYSTNFIHVDTGTRRSWDWRGSKVVTVSAKQRRRKR